MHRDELQAYLSCGEFCRLAKHVAVVYCLDALKRKAAGFFALDTHAGRGFYDLQAAEARKSGEAENGIQRLIRARPGENARCLLCGRRRASRQAPGALSGLPGVIAAGLRPQDRGVFIEWAPAEARAGAREIESPGRIRLEAGDGYAALKVMVAAGRAAWAGAARPPL